MILAICVDIDIRQTLSICTPLLGVRDADALSLRTLVLTSAHFLYSYLQLLSKPKFSGVEKIKTIGSTYMAAAGLSGPPEQTKQVLQ